MQQLKLKWMISLIVWALLISATAVMADEEKEKTQKLDEYQVTATRTRKKAVDVPVNTQVITQAQIRMSGAENLGDVIAKYVTGHFHKYSGLLSPVGLRGFRSESHGDDVKGHVLILVDGHRTGTGNAAKISLDRIDRIEVVKGPMSALYGSAAMGGVINLITKKGSGKIKSNIKGAYGSFDYYKGQVASGGEVNERFYYHLNGSITEMGDNKTPDFGTVYNTSERRAEVGGNFTFYATDNHAFRLGGNYADLSGENSSWTDGTYSAYDKIADDRFDKSNAYADLEYNGQFSDGKLIWKSMAYYLWDRNHWYFRGYDGTPPDDNQSKYTDTTMGTDQQFTVELSDWNELVAGFNMEHLEKASEGKRSGEPTAPYTPGMEYQTYALFLQDAMDLFDNRANLILAARYDHFDVKTKRPETGDFIQFDEKSESYDHLSPKAGVGVKFFDEALRLRTNIGGGFKTPSADQLSANYRKDDDTIIRGNPDLKPETSLSVDVGIDFYHEVFDAAATFWHTDYKDKIVSTSTRENGLTVRSYENSGRAEIEGVDLDVNWWIGRTFNIEPELLLYSRMTFNTKYEDKKEHEDLLYVSDYEVKSGLEYWLGTFRTTLSYVVIGPQKIQNWDNWPATVEEKKAFSYWDLVFRYGFMERFEADLAIYNLFDQDYEWARGFPQPERSFRLGLSFAF